MHDESPQQALEQHLSKLYGKYRGTVTDTVDSLGRGRLKVQVPQVLGESEMWALPCVPYAGKDVGFLFLPKVGTMVWIEFEAGDPSYPIWTGCMWALGDIDPADAPAQDRDVKFLKTEKFMVRVDDNEGKVTIAIHTQQGSSLVIDANQITCESNTITHKASSKKTELTSSSFSVNDGALEVT
jgi:uncharacterized protein involved in type VI secretion and phage assembly